MDYYRKKGSRKTSRILKRVLWEIAAEISDEEEQKEDDKVDFSTFHNALEINNNSMLHENIEKIQPEDRENIMNTLFTSIHSTNKTPELQRLNLESFLILSPKTSHSTSLKRISKLLPTFPKPKLLNPTFSTIKISDIASSTFHENEMYCKGVCLDTAAQNSVIEYP